MESISTSLASLSLQPFPYIPVEVEEHILRFCDPRTLFSTSLVSLAFLELSSPILYEDITVTGIKQLAVLLCVEIEHPQPHLERHLSLSLIRNLKYHHPKVESLSGDTSQESLPRLQHPSRLQRQDPLPLHLNKLHLLVDERSRWQTGAVEPRETLQALFPYFSPRSFILEGVLSDDDEASNLPLVSLASGVHNWTRLRHLSFLNGFTISTLVQSAFLADDHETYPSVNVLYDFSQLEGNSRNLVACEWWFVNLLHDLRGSEEHEDEPLGPQAVEQRLGRIGVVEVLVATEERRTSVLEGLVGTSILARTTVVVRAQG